jgi:WD40 repeat protein
MPVFWTTSSTASFLKGDVKNLSIDNHGRLMLGPAVDLVYESTAPFLWSLVTASDGSIYVGSGNEGKVFKIDPAGKGMVFFDANELEVHALAISPQGELFAGTSPEGRVYKIDRAGAATPFFDPDDKYVWALAFDPQGNLYVGTGEKGIVYRVTPDGRDSIYYKTMTTHAVALAVESTGDLLVGTESPGKLFRVDRNGKGFVLVESSFQEIHAIRLDDDGTIYAAALSGRQAPVERPTEAPRIEPPRAPSGAPVPTVTTEVTSITIVDAGGGAGQIATAPPRDDRRTARGAVYRVSRDGDWDTIWESREDSPYDLSFEMDGSLLIGTGRGGKIYRLTGDPLAATLVSQADADQVTAFLRDGKGSNYYATANPGKLFRLSTERADRGDYESEARDAQTIAAWGILSWRATLESGGKVELFTRSGNTPSPDDTWSAWAGPYKNPDGEEIVSPKARYLQWKAELSGRRGNPILTSVTAAYLPKNARPEVTSITVHPPGTVFQKPFSTGDAEIAGFEDDPPDRRQISASQPGGGQGGGGGAALGRRAYQKGLQTFVWRAQDSNNDELTFDVAYRREGDTAWKPLKKELTSPVFVWDTTSVPNGTYFVKLTASDASSNAPGVALIGELESNAFDIDNTPPVIRVTDVRAGARPTLLFEVRDDQSALQRVEYSVDAERWKPVYPRDGIADSRAEEFELPLEGQAAVTGVIIRATDAMNNIATSRGEPTP